MTVRINKPAINLREKLAELDKPSGLTGEELLRSQTSEEARNSLDLEEHLFEDFESTGIDDNATSTKVTVSDSGVDVTGTVTADGLVVEPPTGNCLVNLKGGSDNSYSYLRFTSKIGGSENYTNLYSDYNASVVIQHDNNNKLATFAHNGDVHLYEDTGTTAKFVWDSSAEVLRINESTSIGLGDTTGDGVQLSGNDVRIKRTCTSSTQGLLHLNNIGTAGNVAEFYLDGVQKGAIGVASDAALTFVNGAGSSEAMRIDSSGRVGIGTSSPDEQLHIHASSGDGILKITGDGSETNGFRLKGFNGGFGINVTDGAGNYPERARIDSSGNLLVGKTSTDTNVDGIRLQPAGSVIATRANNTPFLANRMSSDGDIMEFRKDGSTVGSIRSRAGLVSTIILDPRSGGGGLTGTSGGVEPVDNNGNNTDGLYSFGTAASRFKDLYLSGGVYLGGTGSANKLDDYEEGTFTLTLEGSTTAGTQTGGSSGGKYTRVGNIVTCTFQVVNTTLSGAAGKLKVTGFPFIPNNYALRPAVGVVRTYNLDLQSPSGGYMSPAISIEAGGTFAYLTQTRDNAQWYVVDVENSSGLFIEGTVTYHVA